VVSHQGLKITKLNSKVSEGRLKKTLKFGNKLIVINQPLVMGVLNITPDSFYDKSRVGVGDDLIEKVDQMVADGVSILDIGGYSSRPGASDISIAEEIDRVIPAIQMVRSRFPDLIISIDTFRASVAKEAIDSGANMINDISGGTLDSTIYEVAASKKVPYVLMHMRGNPQNMTDQTSYEDLFIELIDYFNEKLNLLRSIGVVDVIIDPGFGFAKTLNQNFELLKNLSYLQNLDAPMLVGVSRKSMIYKTLGVTANEALNGTTALHMAALLQGADILRVHDVNEATETIKLFNLIKH
jgi:dihydropteroate synthase